MKYIKKIISCLLVIIIIVSSLFSIHNYSKIQTLKTDYQEYKTEEVSIPIEINNRFRHLFSSLILFPFNDIEEYQMIYKERLEVYQTLIDKKDNYDYEFDFKLVLHSMHLKDIQIDCVGLVEGVLFENLEGRNLTPEEIKNNDRIVVINKAFADKMELNVGDTLIIEHYPQKDITSNIELEIIGIYDDGNSNYAGIAYMPLKTLKEISDIWLNEIHQVYQDDVFDYYAPAFFIISDVICHSEEHYDQVSKFLYEYRHENNSFKYSRNNLTHFKADYLFDTTIYEQRLRNSMMVIIVTLIILLIFMKFKGKDSIILEKKLKKQIMIEKEKNVQDIFLMNQETHQLKHDMKHFLIQLSSLIENDEKDKSLEFIKEYYEDIEALEIPTYTQNSTLDLLINHYSKKAKKMNIDFTYSGNMISDLKVNDRKLFILLSNALDNAFNHCNDNKTINVSLTYVEPYHRFVVVNSFDEKKDKNEDKEHGHGLNSMKKLVEEMKGEIIFEEKENKFICTILLP